MQTLADVLVVTPLDEEFRHVRDILNLERKVAERTVTYWTAAMPRPSGGDYLAVFASMGRMGNSAASVFASLAIETWRPRVVVLIGIAGSFLGAKEHNLGDIIVSNEVFGYEIDESKGRRNGATGRRGTGRTRRFSPERVT